MTARFLPDGSCELADEFGVEPSVTWTSIEDWARAWFAEWHSKGHGEACAFIDDACTDATPGVVDALAVLAETTGGDETLLSWVGAGPIEDLVSHYGRGVGVLDEVERSARQNPAFRTALGNVWLADDVPEVVRSRLAALGARVL